MYGQCYDIVLFFFFKHKTAYEMRISDWSSDVCSSDLPSLHGCIVRACLLCRFRMASSLVFSWEIRYSKRRPSGDQRGLSREALGSSALSRSGVPLSRGISHSVCCVEKYASDLRRSVTTATCEPSGAICAYVTR